MNFKVRAKKRDCAPVLIYSFHYSWTPLEKLCMINLTKNITDSI